MSKDVKTKSSVITSVKCCGNCVFFLTDEDDNGKVTDFYHGRNKDSGFCAMRDLFYGVEKTEKPCEDWEYDNGDDC